MDMRAVLDTNIVIYLQKGLLAHPLPPGRYGISIITEMELLSFPELTGEQRAWIERLIRDLTVIGLDEGVKQLAIALRRDYRLLLPDAIIAASARQFGTMLLTNDHTLSKVPGLQCQSLQLK
jgi:predicted nucleic acid-binding protein